MISVWRMPGLKIASQNSEAIQVQQATTAQREIFKVSKLLFRFTYIFEIWLTQ